MYLSPLRLCGYMEGTKLNRTHFYVFSANTWLGTELVLKNIFVSMCYRISRNLKIFVICPNYITMTQIS